MTTPPFIIGATREFGRVAARIKKSDPGKYRKLQKTVRLLRDVGPRHPGLNSHKYSSFTGPNGEEVWESYVENKTPGAWRLFWMYGPGADMITLISVGPHP